MSNDEMIPGLDAILTSMDRGLFPEDRRKMLRHGLHLLGVLKPNEAKDDRAALEDKLERQFKQDGFLRRTEIAYVFNVLEELGLKLSHS